MEDLYGAQNGEIIMLNHAIKRIQITKSRTVRSYCHEFCGYTGLPIQNLLFAQDSAGKQKLRWEANITRSCCIKVLHTEQFKKRQEFQDLKPTLLCMLEESIASDLTLLANGHEFKVHKCLLMSRSPKFFTLLNQ